jgi:hypothetical protein
MSGALRLAFELHFLRGRGGRPVLNGAAPGRRQVQRFSCFSWACSLDVIPHINPVVCLPAAYYTARLLEFEENQGRCAGQ